MGCCCKKRRSARADDSQECCVCDPFAGDAYLTTAQATSIIAFSVSWFWWPTMVLATLVFVSLQAVWCCRMEKRGLLITGILAFFGFVTSLFIGIYMLVVCWQTLFFVVNTDDDYDYTKYYVVRNENCNNLRDNSVAWSVVAFVESALFLIIWYCIFYFIFYRYDSIMAKISKRSLQEEQEQDPAAVAARGNNYDQDGIHHYAAVGIELTPLPVPATATLEAEATIDKKV